MADKPRNPRRPERAPRAGAPGERPASAGRYAGKPGKGPARSRQIGGVDARSMEILEKEGLLSGEGRKLMESARGGAPARSPRPATRGARFEKAEQPERTDRGPAKPGGARQVTARPRLNAAEKEVADRLHKVMAQAGVASRRHSEELIQAGRVTVNGKVVTELGTKVVPGKDLIEVDGRPLGKAENLVHLVINKPKGYVTTLFDPQGRQKVTDLLGEDVAQRVYPVGRLDYDTEGLLLLTNDGELANALMHPAKMVKKTYIAKVRGVPGPAKLKMLESGIELDDGPTAPADVKMVSVNAPNSATISIRIHEGRNRQVRRMLEAVGHEVIHLKRTTLGPLHLGDLPLGEWRELTERELLDLRGAAGIGGARGAMVAAMAERKQTGRRGAARFAKADEKYTPREGAPGRARGPRPYEAEAAPGRPTRAKGPRPTEDAPALTTGPTRGGRPAAGAKPFSGAKAYGGARPSGSAKPYGGGRASGGARSAGGPKAFGAPRSAEGRRTETGKAGVRKNRSPK